MRGRPPVLDHRPSHHCLVQTHDWEWYVSGGRRFYTLGGAELLSHAAVNAAIARDEWVESK